MKYEMSWIAPERRSKCVACYISGKSAWLLEKRWEAVGDEQGDLSCAHCAWCHQTRPLLFPVSTAPQ